MRIDSLNEVHDRGSFDSGVEHLNRYLKTQVPQDVRRGMASCFVLTEDGLSPLGFYTLTATSIALFDLPMAVAKKLPSHPTVPVTLMERVAVDQRAHGQRLGELMLADAFSRALRSEIATYAFVVDGKGEAAEGFYNACRFLPLGMSGRRLFIPMMEIARLFA